MNWVYYWAPDKWVGQESVEWKGLLFTVMLLAYFSRVFFMSRSCGRRRCTFSSSCSFLSWQPCSFDTFSLSLLSIRSSCREHEDHQVSSFLLQDKQPALICVLTSSWETSVPREEPILPFITLPPPVMVPVNYTSHHRDKYIFRKNCIERISKNYNTWRRYKQAFHQNISLKKPLFWKCVGSGVKWILNIIKTYQNVFT